jgi:hypothetical protein
MPVKVELAARLSWAAAACWLVSSALTRLLGGSGLLRFTYSSSRTVTSSENPSITHSETHTQPMPFFVALLALLVVAALWVLLVSLMRGGVNWARIVLTVLGVLGSMGSLVGELTVLATPELGAADVVGAAGQAVVLVLVVAALIAMHHRSASAYFRRPAL